MSGFKAGGTDLDSLFASGSGGAATGFKNGGTDLNARYASGSRSGTVGFKVGGTDLTSRFSGGGGGGVQNPFSGGAGTWFTSVLNPGTATADVTVRNDGAVDGYQVGTDGSWYSPTTSGIGNSYWVKFTHTGGSAPTPVGFSLGSYVQLTANRQVTLTRSGVGVTTSNFRVDVSNNGTDGGIVSTTNCTLSAIVEDAS